MRKWTYRCVDLGSSPEAKLNGLGTEGWELVTVTETVEYGSGRWHRTAYLKRQVVDGDEPSQGATATSKPAEP